MIKSALLDAASALRENFPEGASELEDKVTAYDKIISGVEVDEGYTRRALHLAREDTKKRLRTALPTDDIPKELKERQVKPEEDEEKEMKEYLRTSTKAEEDAKAFESYTKACSILEEFDVSDPRSRKDWRLIRSLLLEAVSTMDGCMTKEASSIRMKVDFYDKLLSTEE